MGLALFDEVIKRDIIVRQRSCGYIARLGQQLAEGDSVRQRGTKDNRIDEQPHQLFQLGQLAPRGYRADQDVFLAGVAVEQTVQTSQQPHKQSRPGALAELLQGFHMRTRNQEPVQDTTESLQGRTRMVGLQFQERCVRP